MTPVLADMTEYMAPDQAPGETKSTPVAETGRCRRRRRSSTTSTSSARFANERGRMPQGWRIPPHTLRDT